MAALLADIKPGDEVIMPSYTFVSTADAFVLRGATAVFVDIRPDTLNIDETLIEDAITDKTRAIVPVHYAGVACEMDTIMDIAKRHNLLVIEDAAQGVMSTYKGQALGSIGDFGCYSFHETKNYSMGEGGCLLIKDIKNRELAEIIREKGKLVAAKRADRETSEGAVLARVNGSKAAMVCLGCETDFVSATPDFKALANEIADAAAASFPADVEGLKAAPCSNGHSVEEEISVQTGKTGEKHVLAYYATLEAPYIAEYIHLNGKIGAIVAFNKSVDEALGRAVAMQVASMNPVSVGEADCPKEVVEKELEMYKKQMAEDPKMAGKPEAMLENIAKGKLQKFFKEQTLEDQDFVQADEKISVKDYIKKVDAEAKILAFRRFSLSD